MTIKTPLTKDEILKHRNQLAGYISKRGMSCLVDHHGGNCDWNEKPTDEKLLQCLDYLLHKDLPEVYDNSLSIAVEALKKITCDKTCRMTSHRYFTAPCCVAKEALSKIGKQEKETK